MILFIDTSDKKFITLGLIQNGHFILHKKFKALYKQSEKILPLIERFLHSMGFTAENIDAISVIKGPGSFTSLRVGVISANTLSYSLKIPVVGINKNEFRSEDVLASLIARKLKGMSKKKFVEPYYGQEPNITQKKKA